jgi:glycosyltransferase involved in cell wall biosynthesis
MSRRLRVVHLDTNRRWGGGEAQVLELVRGLDPGSFHPLLLARPGSELSRRARDAGCEVEAFDFSWPYAPRAILRLRRRLRALGASLLHLHDGTAVSLGVPAGAGLRGLALVVHRRIASPLRRNPATRWKYAPKRIAAYVAVSESARRSLLDVGVPPAKIHLIPSGLDPRRLAPAADRAHLRAELGLLPGLWLGTACALEPKKNVETFVRAAALLAAQLPEARFLVLGDGPERAQLEGLGARLGLVPKRLRFEGLREDATRWIAALDLFVFPSLREGSPGVVKEAMAVGVPVLAADAPGTREVVAHDTGRLVPPFAADAYAEAALALLEDPAGRAALAARAREHVCRHFDVRLTLERTARLYRELTQASA